MKKIIITTLILLMFLSTISFAAMNQIKVIKTAPDGTPLIGLFPAQHTDVVVLTAETPVSYSIPSGGVYALINCTADVWVRFNGSAAIPTVSVTNGSASTLNPALRALQGTNTIGFVSPVDCKCSIDIWNR
jgi:hypothetical protein